MNLSNWRDEFPVASVCAYFDHAAVAPVSRRVADAVERFIGEARDCGRLNYAAWEQRGEEVRGAAARLLGAANDEVAFVAGTSDGLSAVATAVDWRPGDSVVTAAGEFPANVYPWWGLARLGVETRIVPIENARLTLDSLIRFVDRTTRVVSVSAVDFAAGQRRPLAAIGEFCRRRGILFCVDAIQALGAVVVDVERDAIDCLAADGHKWLCAPEGCGILYVSRRWCDKLTPRRLGWKSVTDEGRYLPYHFDLKPNTLKFECGSLNYLGIHALGAAIDMMIEIGLHEVERRLLEVTARLRGALSEDGFAVVSPGGVDERSGITTVRTGQDPRTVVAALRKAGVLASARGGGVRFSPHFYCDQGDIERCMEVLRGA